MYTQKRYARRVCKALNFLMCSHIRNIIIDVFMKIGQMFKQKPIVWIWSIRNKLYKWSSRPPVLTGDELSIAAAYTFNIWTVVGC